MKLLDLNLPRMYGREALEEIKADPHLKVIPAVVLTTSAAERDLLEAYHLHANAYIIKPIDLDLLTLTCSSASFMLSKGSGSRS